MRAGASAALLLSAVLTAIAPRAIAQTAAVPKPPDIDVRLFSAQEADRSKGCSFVFWQANRDLDKDRFVYALFEPLGRNESRGAARVKIGDKVVELTRIAVGGKKVGYGIYPFMLYRSQAGSGGIRVIAEITAEDGPGEVVDVTDGSLIFVENGRAPFVLRVKGNAGCNTPAAPAPAQASAPAQRRPEAPPAAAASSAGSPAVFEKYNVPGARIPRGMIAQAEQKLGCNATVMRGGATGYSLSEESALWEIPCARYAYQAASVYAIVYAPDPAKQFEFITIEAPRGKQRNADLNNLMNPVWDMRARVVSSTSLGRAGGDCGTFERHKVGEDGRLTLIEYREKEPCDGKVVPPAQWPLVFRAR